MLLMMNIKRQTMQSWSKFSDKLTSYLDTVTLGSLIDEAKPKTNEIDLDELNDYYKNQN